MYVCTFSIENETIKRLAIEKANSNCQSLSVVIERLVAQRHLGLTDYM